MTFFLPTISGAVTAGVGIYTTREGYYQNKLNIITYQFVITWTSHSGTGQMRISLPEITKDILPQVFGFGLLRFPIMSTQVRILTIRNSLFAEIIDFINPIGAPGMPLRVSPVTLNASIVYLTN